MTDFVKYIGKAKIITNDINQATLSGVIRVITKIAFLARLKPYWPEYRAAKVDEGPAGNDAANGFPGKVADAIDHFIDLFELLSFVDLDDPQTSDGINELVENILTTTPSCLVTSEILLDDGTEEEKY